MSERAYHHGDLRRAMVEVAVEKTRREGSEALVLRDIAAQIGVSATAAYRHFSNKSELVEAMVLAGFEKLSSEVDSAHSGICLDNFGSQQEYRFVQLWNVALCYVNFVQEEGNWYRAMTDPALDSHTVGAGFSDLYAHIERSIAELVRLEAFSLQEPGDIHMEIAVLWSAMHGAGLFLTDALFDTWVGGKPAFSSAQLRATLLFRIFQPLMCPELLDVHRSAESLPLEVIR